MDIEEKYSVSRCCWCCKKFYPLASNALTGICVVDNKTVIAEYCCDGFARRLGPDDTR